MAGQSEKKANGFAATDAEVSCGLIMPISMLENCGPEHWGDVKSIVTQAIHQIPNPKFSVRLVSDADDVGVIQKRIVQNVYNSDVVIFDVSGKNPNVMFELGLRLAFDKPTVIIKDDKTDYSFDTGVIEQVPYPRDLRFNRMVVFQEALAAKVLATYLAAKSDPNHSTFLKNFGTFHVADLTQSVVSTDKIVVDLLNEIQSEISGFRRFVGRDHDKRRQDDDEASGAAKIALELSKIISDNPKTDVVALLGDEKFAIEMSNRCQGHRYYANFSSFKNALDRAASLFQEDRIKS